MDEKGYILTADSTLALIVVIVLTATVASYSSLPMYMGQDHQHLEALADSQLQSMEQDGTLKQASVEAANGSTADSFSTLNDSLNSIPDGIGYRLIMNVGGTIVVADSSDRNYTPLTHTDTATRVRVISGPDEGWWGRAWFKSEPVEFTNKEIHLTTTVWNFHNWLTNFSPWSTYGLRDRPYWGSSSTGSVRRINFAIPEGAVITGARYLQGGSASSNGQSFGTNTYINTNPALVANSNQFTFLNLRPRSNTRMYNYQGDIPVASLHTLVNNFYVQILPRPFYSGSYDMPWFSILADYATNITIPENVTEDTYNFTNAAGLAVPNPVDLGAGSGYGRIYDLDSGTVTNLNTRRVINWNDMRNHDHAFDDGIPFVITNVPGVSGTGHGTGVSVVEDVPIASNTNLLDAYVVVNSWGANDGALVEIWDSESNNWRTVFCSFDVWEGGVLMDYSDRTDGYGNLPGIIYIGDQLREGANNKVRITVFDDVPSSDYDLCGVQDSYVKVFTSPYKVRWTTYPFNSHQDNDNTAEQVKSFGLTTDSQKAMLFVGVGLNTRNILVEYADTGEDLYNGPPPFALDLAQLDAQNGYHKITTDNSTGGNYTIRAGNYNLRVRVTGPTYNWESGDWDSNAAIFSGTRIAVINPQIQNEWSAGMGATPQAAMDNATAILLQKYPEVDPADIHTSALFAGNVPNAVTVRLDLWKQ